MNRAAATVRASQPPHHPWVSCAQLQKTNTFSDISQHDTKSVVQPSLPYFPKDHLALLTTDGLRLVQMVSSSETCDAVLCDLECTADADATCVTHIASGGATVSVESDPQSDGTCQCPSGYKLDLVSNSTHLLCHKRKNCACTAPNGEVHQVRSVHNCRGWESMVNGQE